MIFNVTCTKQALIDWSCHQGDKQIYPAFFFCDKTQTKWFRVKCCYIIDTMDTITWIQTKTFLPQANNSSALVHKIILPTKG